MHNCHCVGLSVLSGAHLQLAFEVIEGMRQNGLGDVPVVVGGVIPPEDELALKREGVAEVYTPKRFELSVIMREIIDLIDSRN
jgi:(2R)-ethylmalonyl-CoA mutase